MEVNKFPSLIGLYILPSFLFLGTMEVNKYCPRCYTCYSPTSSFLIPPPLSFLSQYLSFHSVTHSSSSSLLRCHYHPTPSSSHSIIIPLHHHPTLLIPRLLIPLFSPVRLIYTNIGYTLLSFLLSPLISPVRRCFCYRCLLPSPTRRRRRRCI